LARTFRARWMRHRWRRLLASSGQHDLARADQSRCAVGDDEQRRDEAPTEKVGEEVGPGVVALGLPGGEAHEDRRPFDRDSPGAEHRLGRGPRVELEVAAVEEQVVEVDRREVPGPPGLELLLDGLTDPRDGRLRQRRLRAEGLGQGGFDVTNRQAPDEAGDDEGLQGVGPGNAHPEESGDEGLVGAPELRALEGDRARCRLDRGRAVAVAAALPGPLAADVALPAQELGHLGLEGGLDQETDAPGGPPPPGLRRARARRRTADRCRRGRAQWGILVSTRVWVSFRCLSGLKGTYARFTFPPRRGRHPAGSFSALLPKTFAPSSRRMSMLANGLFGIAGGSEGPRSEMMALPSSGDATRSQAPS
jgi:hypothetical protein